MRNSHINISLASTDLSNFLSCRHLSKLDLNVAKGLGERPVRYGPFIDDLKARGIAHEEAYLDYLKASGLSVVDATEVSHHPTLARLTEGFDVIYQVTLSDESWSGRADFLIKVDTPSSFGDWSYEIIDTKLARDTKAGTIPHSRRSSFAASMTAHGYGPDVQRRYNQARLR